MDKVKKNINGNSLIKSILSVRKRAMNYADVFYFLFLCILINTKSTFIEFSPYMNLSFALAALCLGVKYLLTDWSFRDICVSACLLLLAFASFLNSGHSIMLVTCAGIVGAKDVKIKNIAIWVCYYRIAHFILTFALFNLELVYKIDEPTYGALIFEDGEWIKEVIHRYNLGFSKSNPAHVVFFICVSGYIAAFFKKYNIIHAAAILFINEQIYLLTHGRTGHVLVIVIVLLALVLKNKTVFKYFSRILPALTAGIIAFCLMGTALYGKVDIMYTVNTAFSERFSLSQAFFNAVPVSLLGANFTHIELPLDLAYFNLFLNYGVIFFVLFLFGNGFLLYKSSKEGRVELALLLIAFAVLGVTENYILDIGMNFTLIYFGELLFSDRAKKDGGCLYENRKS